MGYDSAAYEADIDSILVRCDEMAKNGQDCFSYIEKAHGEYPNDFRITQYYLLSLTGGYADNDNSVLLEREDEINSLCSFILSKCNDMRIRMDAVNIQAKLYHAKGKTEKAIVHYRENFPTFWQTEEQKIEQLFAKDTLEFNKQLVSNMIELADFSANKKLKEIWFCLNYSLKEKVSAGIEFGKAIGQLSKAVGDRRLCYVEYSIFSDHAWKAAYFGAEESDIAEILELCLVAAKRCDELAETDEIFRSFMTDDESNAVINLLPTKIKNYMETNMEKQKDVREMPKCRKVLEMYMK